MDGPSSCSDARNLEGEEEAAGHTEEAGPGPVLRTQTNARHVAQETSCVGSKERSRAAPWRKQTFSWGHSALGIVKSCRNVKGGHQDRDTTQNESDAD